MCGICGKINFLSDKFVTHEEIQMMTNTLYHRGPDDEGIFIDNAIGLGFRRLSIIDLSTGHQPLSNENETVWIVFNGEIYNYIELRNDLKLKGHIFRTKTDTETIVHLYEEYKEDCVSYLRGMFSFVIWDANKKRLFCARDRFGIKPFFYTVTKGSFIFASEIKAILTSRDYEKRIDLNVLNEYFAYGYISRNRSIFKDIKKLLPGHYLIIDTEFPGKLLIKQYWKIRFVPDNRTTEKEWIEKIQATFDDAVKIRLMSDVPLGAFLSGGVDSCSVVALMARNSSQPIKTFTIGFKEVEYNELKYARLLSERYHTEHHEQIIEPESVAVLSSLVKGYDEPFADSSAIPTFYVSKFAKEYVTVVLSGDGGDELFAGYDNYQRFISLQRHNILPEKVNSTIFGTALKLIPDNVKGKKLLLYLSQNKKLASVYSGLWHNYERKKLFSKELLFQIDLDLPEIQNADNLNAVLLDADFISSLQWQDILTYLPDDILTKVDRASMLNSLEVRVPILDHKLAELSFSIPSNFKYNPKGRKYIFKKAMAQYLPAEILSHKKQGFGVPLTHWFKKDLKEYVADRIHSGNQNLSQYFDINYIENIKKIHNTGQRDFNSKLWSLLFFDAWYEYHFHI